MITIADLTADFPFVLLAGESAIDRPIRWVHLSEHEDPAQWLSGGELVLTTGYNLDSAEKQRRFVLELAGQDAAGLGFGTGFDHADVPAAMVDLARELNFPLFIVPYSTPFIAITERASKQLVNDRYDALEQGSKIQAQLQLQVIEGGGLDAIVSSISRAVSGAAYVFDPMGRIISRSSEPDFEVEPAAEELMLRTEQRRPVPFSPDSIGDRGLAVPIPGGQGDRTDGWLVIVSARGGALGAFEALLARLSSTVVGLCLMRMRTVRETESRLVGDLLRDALEGRSSPADIASQLGSLGLDSRIAVLVFEAGKPELAEFWLSESLAKRPVPALVAVTEANGKTLVCVIIDASAVDPVEFSRDLHAALPDSLDGCRAAASQALPNVSLRRAFHEARCALEASSLGPDPPDVASHEDLGAFTLLLSMQDDEALRRFSEAVLGSIEVDNPAQTAELLHSLDVYLECNGNWERAAKLLYCHRHTLRHRIRKIEEMSGRDLHRVNDRIEFWLALRAKQLVA
ncbi:MAG TPA: PucR family transcriptional regulator ligand-binding domain-containing protein [Solirubrobacterales bacterium]|nr:PucR family transcriptional regulator ligand-binding domain-containing protein [Solirubrobacterales bacterium]